MSWDGVDVDTVGIWGFVISFLFRSLGWLFLVIFLDFVDFVTFSLVGSFFLRVGGIIFTRIICLGDYYRVFRFRSSWGGNYFF